MDPRSIKNKYGRCLSFWGGGVDTQTTLPFGSKEDVIREVRERVRLLGPGGGYVFATIHNIQPDIFPEKILAVYDTVMDCGKYPLGERSLSINWNTSAKSTGLALLGCVLIASINGSSMGQSHGASDSSFVMPASAVSDW